MYEYVSGVATGLLIAGCWSLVVQIYWARKMPQPRILKGPLAELTAGEERAALRDEHAGLREVFPTAGVKRLEVMLTDWGEDFTGEDDVLGRWRWEIWDHNHESKKAASPPGTFGVTVPHMLGNEKTWDEAVAAANEWACDTYGRDKYWLYLDDKVLSE